MTGLLRSTAIAAAILAVLGTAGCQTTDSNASASATANQMADRAIYRPVDYQNAAIKGASVIVLPGNIKSNNATFAQKYTANNIADYAELELNRANFTVLERANLGPMQSELALAYNQGDPSVARKLFKLGAYKTTKHIVVFDVLKAEPVAAASRGFDGRPIGAVAGALIGGTGGYVTSAVVGSAQAEETAGIWIIGMRYKILDANTTEQVGIGYFEDKMEVGTQSSSFMGVSQGTAGGVTLDTMVQRLVQVAVAEIDTKYKRPPAPQPASAPAPSGKKAK